MPTTPEVEVTKHQWVCGAVRPLEALRAATEGLRRAIEADSSTSPGNHGALSAPVVAAAASLTEWLETSRAPIGLRRAEAELGATAGVYRNAAVAFSSLSDAGPDQHAARRAACAKLLDQGDHHVEVFFSLLKKRRLVPSPG